MQPVVSYFAREYDETSGFKIEVLSEAFRSLEVHGGSTLEAEADEDFFEGWMRIDMGWYALTWQIVVERQLIKHAARFVKVAIFSDRLLQMNRLCLLVILERMENGSEVYRI